MDYSNITTFIAALLPGWRKGPKRWIETIRDHYGQTHGKDDGDDNMS